MICTKSRAKHDAKNKDALIEDGGEKGENRQVTLDFILHILQSYVLVIS